MSAKITDAELAAAHALFERVSGRECLSNTDVHGVSCNDVVQAIADARAAGALHQRRIDAAHAFDRCEQYQHDSGSYEAVNEVAISIAKGAANEADRHGEFEPELLARVDRIAARRGR